MRRPPLPPAPNVVSDKGSVFARIVDAAVAAVTGPASDLTSTALEIDREHRALFRLLCDERARVVELEARYVDPEVDFESDGVVRTAIVPVPEMVVLIDYVRIGEDEPCREDLLLTNLRLFDGEELGPIIRRIGSRWWKRVEARAIEAICHDGMKDDGDERLERQRDDEASTEADFISGERTPVVEDAQDGRDIG